MLIILCVFVFYFKKEQVSYEKIEVLATHYNGMNFVGSSNCKKCHADIYQTHIETAHFKTTQFPSKKSISSYNDSIKNEYIISEKYDYIFKVEHDSFYQILHNKTLNKNVKYDKVDYVIGSGVKGQSFLSWDKNKLYQIQMSYSVLGKKWINSPGFSKKIQPKQRPITSRCLECHSTFVKHVENKKNENTFERKSLVLGIDCERCHGPASNHVNYHINNKEEITGRHIQKFSKLTRKQKLDMCALCHSGLRQERLQKPFVFTVGDNLDYHSYEDVSFKELDVHGNQVGLLKESKCFIHSKMECMTCHDPHKNERGNNRKFNDKCIECHKLQTKCKNTDNKSNDCIACHMPVIKSKAMRILDANGENIVKVRTHKIKVYDKVSDEIDLYIDRLKEEKY